MPSDPHPLDVGLLSPVSAGHDAAVSDAAVLDALVAAEVALVRALGAGGAGEVVLVEDTAGMPEFTTQQDLNTYIAKLESDMREAAKKFEF